MVMDRSKYRNPDMPLGYTKKDPDFKYKEGLEIDGEHLIWALLIHNSHLDQRDDYATLDNLIIMSDDEDVVEEECIIPPHKIKKEKGTGENTAVSKKVSKHEKKDHGRSDTSNLSIALSSMDIDNEKTEKKKKIKIERDSGSPPPISTHKHKKSKEHKNDHKRDPINDNHSPPHSSRKYKQSIVSYSPSPPPLSPERYPDVKVKIEPEEPQHLFGSYHCDVCNITMNSLLTYNTHINGKRHRKNMKAKNVPEVAAKSIPATVLSENESKYPRPRPGVIRKKVQKPSEIQHIIEKNVNQPCPGLNLVTEIKGIESVQYYCAMCDSVCSSSSIIPHLIGFKHQLKTLKEFKPGAYDLMSYQPKYKIEKELLTILHAIQKKEGIGRMAVEVEELSSYDVPFSAVDSRDLPSTSWGAGQSSNMDFKQLYNQATIPDKSSSDFYCYVCESHMNSMQMWEAHIRGKRHLTNLKKLPGDRPSKVKTIPMNDRNSILLDRLKHECSDEPIVGLKEIRETQILETNSCSYQCFLCGSCHTSLDIIEHLISLKHRTKYLDHIDFPGREVISGMSDSAAYGLVTEMCEQVESEEGRVKPSVHISKF